MKSWTSAALWLVLAFAAVLPIIAAVMFAMSALRDIENLIALHGVLNGQ